MKDFAKSIRTENQKVGNEDWSDLIRAAKKRLEDAKKFGWAETGYNGWTKKDVEDLEKKIKELEQKQRTGNSKVGNEAIVLKDGDVWVVLYANETKSKEFDTEAEARAFAKQVGNSKVGNSAYDDMRQAKIIADGIEGKVKREGLTPEVKNWANIEIGKINQIADYLENSAKSVRDTANKMKQIVK